MSNINKITRKWILQVLEVGEWLSKEEFDFLTNDKNRKYFLDKLNCQCFDIYEIISEGKFIVNWRGVDSEELEEVLGIKYGEYTRYYVDIEG